MPHFIVKPDRDRDEYVEWSTIVDAPVDVGTRSELGGRLGNAGGSDRFDRADASGSSARGDVQGWFGWDDEWFHLGNFHWDGFAWEWRVHRSNLAAYARADLDGDEDAARSLAEHVERA